MKTFAYFEQTDGGMNVLIIHSSSELECLFGWMDEICKYSDEYLISWMDTSEVGSMLPHRLGYIVRLVNSK